MKCVSCEKLEWFALAGPGFRYLESQRKIVDRKKSKQIYRQMTAGTPEAGGLMENPLRICLSGGMVWLAICEATDGKLEETCFGEIVNSKAKPGIKLD